MPVYEITAPDGRKFRVTAPEGATKEDALARVQAQLAPAAPDKAPDPTGSFGENLLAGAGKAFADAGRGLEQVFPFRDRTANEQDIAESRKRDAPLMSTGGGMTGNVAGNVAMAVPAALIPGVNTTVGAGVLGAGMGAMQPTLPDESRAFNTAVGTVGGVAGKVGADKLGQAIASRLAGAEASGLTRQAENQARDAILEASKKAGYVVPPNSAKPGVVNAALEGVSGKIKTAQVASEKNQVVTNDLAKTAVGLSKDDLLTESTLEGIRKTAGKAYEAIKAVPGRFKADAEFNTAIKSLGNDFTAAAQEFPEIAGSPAIDTLRTALSKPDMSPKAAVELIKKLRFDANKNFKAFDDPAKGALAVAQKDAANAIEELVERSLPGTNLLKDFRDARTLIAKTYTIEAALQNGNVSAVKLASQLGKGAPLTGELKTAADFAQMFPKAAQALKEPAGAVSPLDFGLALGTGNPAGLVARPAVRSTILSKPYQAAMTTPDYGPNALLRLGAGAANNALVQRASPAVGAGIFEEWR